MTSIQGLVRMGRPRDESRDTVILNAALELVSEVGYERVSMDAIASRAKASKATIYRRWSSKGALVAAAVKCRVVHEASLPDSGSFRGDLINCLTLMARTMEEQDFALLTGVFAGMRSDEELADALRCDMLAEKVELTTPLFARALERGEIRSLNAMHLFHEIAPAMVFHRILTIDEPCDDAFVAHVVDDVLVPVLSITAGLPRIPSASDATPSHTTIADPTERNSA